MLCGYMAQDGDSCFSGNGGGQSGARTDGFLRGFSAQVRVVDNAGALKAGNRLDIPHPEVAG